MKLFGVPIRIHPTFLWLVLFVALTSGPVSAVWVVVLFAFVVLHELSHSLVARAHGVRVHDITLLGLGGMARMGQMPEDAATEFRIAIAGPLFNFAVAAIAYGLIIGVCEPLNVKPSSWLFILLVAVLEANLVLGIFNLLPAFPMDGGRVLRAYFTARVGFLEATHRAARVGRWVSGGMAIFGCSLIFNGAVFNGFILLLIAGYMYVAGKREEMMVAVQHAARGFGPMFGFGEPPPGAQSERGPRANDAPPEPQTHGDVIDVEGHVVPEDDGSAADAFRQLSEDVDAQLKT